MGLKVYDVNSILCVMILEIWNGAFLPRTRGTARNIGHSVSMWLFYLGRSRWWSNKGFDLDLKQEPMSG